MESILKRTSGVSGTVIFIYTSLLMFVLRFFAGPIAHKFSPIGMLFFCSILTTGGLYLLGMANERVMAFAAATVFGLGITYYWPTMLGVTAERFPKGGALVLGLMGCIGNLAISQATTQIGKVYDSGSVEALSPTLRHQNLEGPGGQQVPMTVGGDIPQFLPPEAVGFLYPAGGQKLNPEAVKLLKTEEKKDTPEAKAVENAETEGAKFALTRIAVMPALLVVIFGLLALIDKLRGGYRAEVLTYAPATRPDYGPKAGPYWPKDLTR
jgi:hypothetical protein